jgi:hypothetical protein
MFKEKTLYVNKIPFVDDVRWKNYSNVVKLEMKKIII